MCKSKGKVRGFLYGLLSVKGVGVRVELLYFLPLPITLFSVQQQLLFSLYKTRGTGHELVHGWGPASCPNGVQGLIGGRLARGKGPEKGPREVGLPHP